MQGFKYTSIVGLRQNKSLVIVFILIMFVIFVACSSSFLFKLVSISALFKSNSQSGDKLFMTSGKQQAINSLNCIKKLCWIKIYEHLMFVTLQCFEKSVYQWLICIFNFFCGFCLQCFRKFRHTFAAIFRSKYEVNSSTITRFFSQSILAIFARCFSPVLKSW